MPIHKLSASALSTFLKSPKAFYWRYRASLEPIQPSVATYDHEKLAGIIWAEFVDRFYKGTLESENVAITLQRWNEDTDGWVPEKAKDKLTAALKSLMPQYYQQFSPDDGCRAPGQSEMLVEDERFLGYLDGLSAEGIVHEVKMTSRSPQLAGQLWKVEHSLQVRLYCVLTQAQGYQIEFAWKDLPYAIFRGPVSYVTENQRAAWHCEFMALADAIEALSDDPCNYPCHPDQCCLVTKGVTSMCQYMTLCDMGLDDVTRIGYKPKTRR